MRRTFSGAIARHWLASTSRTWLVPIPKAMAPKAPWVEVWLSPQAIVMPGWVRPSSGPITWTMPWSPLSGIEELDVVVAAVALELAHHRFGQRSSSERTR